MFMAHCIYDLKYKCGYFAPIWKTQNVGDLYT
uniref:Uncharacterized protein n=1 Tax=Arundo donax TaxID=35708 RepID=A0A0A8YU68_ARUDO